MAGSHSERHSDKSRTTLMDAWDWMELKEMAQFILIFVIIPALLVILIVAAFIYNPFTESGQRSIKTFRSDWGGGIERTVTVYDQYGDVLQEWHGTFDVDNNDQEVYFDIDGKRVIIQGGVVIVQEETEEEWQVRVAQRDS